MTKSLTANKQLSRPGPGEVPAAVARGLLRLVEEYDGDARRFLRAASLSHLGFLVDRSHMGQTIARDDFTRLYARAIARLDTHAARQEGRESLTKLGVDMMCHAIITCRTMRSRGWRAFRSCSPRAPAC